MRSLEGNIELTSTTGPGEELGLALDHPNAGIHMRTTSACCMEKTHGVFMTSCALAPAKRAVAATTRVRRMLSMVVERLRSWRNNLLQIYSSEPNMQ